MADIASIPRGTPIMRMRWLHLLFIHWRIEPTALRPLVPDAFEIDTFDGSAWIGLVPFTMKDVSPIILPRFAIRSVTDFHECNVRTYVRRGNDRGVFFFSLDAASRIGVWGARTFFHLPYFNARIDLHRDGNEIDYAVDRVDEPRATMRCRWRVGNVRDATQPGDLAHFLTERYQLMTVDRCGWPRRCRIWHEPWPLRDATLMGLEDKLVAAAGMPIPDEEPIVYHADALDVRAWRLERVV
jgi:uncharacterized protein